MNWYHCCEAKNKRSHELSGAKKLQTNYKQPIEWAPRPRVGLLVVRSRCLAAANLWSGTRRYWCNYTLFGNVSRNVQLFVGWKDRSHCWSVSMLVVSDWHSRFSKHKPPATVSAHTSTGEYVDLCLLCIIVTRQLRWDCPERRPLLRVRLRFPEPCMYTYLHAYARAKAIFCGTWVPVVEWGHYVVLQ